MGYMLNDQILGLLVCAVASQVPVLPTHPPCWAAVQELQLSYPHAGSRLFNSVCIYTYIQDAYYGNDGHMGQHNSVPYM